MKAVDTLHQRRPELGGAMVFAALSLLLLGCAKKEKSGTAGESAPPDSEAASIAARDTDRATPAPDPSEFTGHPRRADVNGIRRYADRLEWRLDTVAEIDIGGGQRATVKLESERGAYNIDESGYQRGRIIAKITQVGGAPWPLFGLRPGGTVYWWAQGEFPQTSPRPGSVIIVPQGEALYVDLDTVGGAWKSYGLLYHYHDQRLYPEQGKSGKFTKLKKKNGNYELLARREESGPSGDVAAARAISPFSLTSFDKASPGGFPALVLQSEVDVMWEACIRGCCAPRAL